MVWKRQSSSSIINNHNPVQSQDLLPEDGLPFNVMSNAMDQSISSVNAQTPVRSQDLLAELPSSLVASVGIVQSWKKGILEYIVKENDGGEEAAPAMHQPSSVAANGLGASAGPSNIHQTIVEENDGGEGCSLNGRRLYCKKRAPKDKQLGAGLVLTLEVAPVMHQPLSVVASGLRAGCSLDGMRLYYKRRAPENEQFGARRVLALEAALIMHQPSSVVASGLGAGVGLSDIHQTIGVAGEAHTPKEISV
ncbi:hypothetical protein GH714_028802 [Hevea brasiliensis]|uniref:Uncharacterized protein n=1 Tax=Hevea brasiliensis TaxID=3981 RepID=A0A6A6N5J8_HEVBR|nr:hypothetical protein GH714_028802 [Hevea brasiliensis]